MICIACDRWCRAADSGYWEGYWLDNQLKNMLIVEWYISFMSRSGKNAVALGLPASNMIWAGKQKKTSAWMTDKISTLEYYSVTSSNITVEACRFKLWDVIDLHCCREGLGCMLAGTLLSILPSSTTPCGISACNWLPLVDWRLWSRVCMKLFLQRRKLRTIASGCTLTILRLWRRPYLEAFDATILRDETAAISLGVVKVRKLSSEIYDCSTIAVQMRDYQQSPDTLTTCSWRFTVMNAMFVRLYWSPTSAGRKLGVPLVVRIETQYWTPLSFTNTRS